MIGDTGIRTFQVVQYVTGPLEGNIDDWPPVIQDKVYAALEAKAQEVQLPLVIIASYCDKDHDSTDETKVWFLRIVASEVVAADDRLVNPGRLH